MTNQYYEFQYEGGAESAPQDRITWAVQRLILINIAVFAIQLVLDIPLGGPLSSSGGTPPGGLLFGILAFQPTLFTFGCVWKPFTYMFIHGSLMHLFFNVLWLYFFGPDVERELGTRQFIRFYVICGALAVMGTLSSMIVFGGDVSVTGASGATMAIMVAFAMLYPERQLYLFPLPRPINTKALVIVVIAINVVVALQRNSTTSAATHFGGMLAGYGYMKLLPVINRKRTTYWKNWREKHGPYDKVGDAVDNIFKMDDWRRGK